MHTVFEYPTTVAGFEITAFGREREVYAIAFGNSAVVRKPIAKHFDILEGSSCDEIPSILREYDFTGNLDGLRPVFLWGTDFQKAVWMQLQKIKWGETITYKQLAVSIGRPNSARPVGQAVGANHIPIIVPCHRIVSASGIGGYSGGLEIKRKLLALEGAAFFKKK